MDMVNEKNYIYILVESKTEIVSAPFVSFGEICYVENSTWQHYHLIANQASESHVFVVLKIMVIIKILHCMCGLSLLDEKDIWKTASFSLQKHNKL